LFFSAATFVRSGPVLSSTNFTAIPVAWVKAFVTAASYPCAE